MLISLTKDLSFFLFVTGKCVTSCCVSHPFGSFMYGVVTSTTVVYLQGQVESTIKTTCACINLCTHIVAVCPTCMCVYVNFHNE